MPRLKHLLFQAAAVVIGLVLALVLVEIALRIARWPGPPLLSGRLETRHHSPPSRPDFRDRGSPLREEKPAGVFRIVVVGDSFAWGAGVLPQDAYPDRMGDELQRRARRAASSPAFEVVNFSRPGWNTTQELGALARWFDRLAPDLLVLGYCLNDAEPHQRRELARLRRDVHPRQPETAVERVLYARSAVFRLVFHRADNVRMRRATAAYYHRFYVDGQPTWEATRSALAEMRDLAASRGAPFVLVVFPIFDSQLDHRYRYHALHETVTAAAAELGIDAVDLLPRYLGIDARRLALDPFLDAHPSELAHRIAAMAILEELEQRALLPEGEPSEESGVEGTVQAFE
ncbi:MAG TPA: SGNH/GDSL hydrolase family protein [Thermoanaerobaculia bacterium]|nr:SGNH/GDSL hydrolase family protein [Thermoanaerobaculia bacterium]